jgi:hypothetical protein
MASSRNRSNTRKQEEKQEPKNTPVFSKRYWTGAGNIEVAVFENVTGEGDDERVVLSTSLKKTYKDAKGDYQDSKSFFPAELTIAAFALNEAAAFCFSEQNRK